MAPVNTDFDRAGTWPGTYSADTTAQDYAKLGLLFLRGGEWDGEQILPEECVEFSRTPSPAEPDYGAHWWLDPLRPGVSYAVGIRGNVITVDPAHDLVIVQLSTVAGSLPLDHTEAILDAFAAIDDRCAADPSGQPSDGMNVSALRSGCIPDRLPSGAA